MCQLQVISPVEAIRKFKDEKEIDKECLEQCKAEGATLCIHPEFGFLCGQVDNDDAVWYGD